jgi:hypothetical protein
MKKSFKQNPLKKASSKNEDTLLNLSMNRG